MEKSGMVSALDNKEENGANKFPKE